MKVKIAFSPEIRKYLTWQTDFPETTSCCRCSKISRLGFIAYEAMNDDKTKPGRFLCDLHPNISMPGKGRIREMWLHNSCCVAVYFCTKCLEPTALYNQG